MFLCATIGLILFVSEMLFSDTFSPLQISSGLFLLGALAGIGALGMSYVTEAQERTSQDGTARQRTIARILLGIAYAAMIGAFINLIS